jgi:serine/threonine protein kinase
MIIANKYKIIDRLGSGSFSQIYKGENIRTKELVAIKVEPLKNETKMLKHESRIYQYLGNTIHIPQLKWFGTDDTNYYMVLSLLGNSLASIKPNTLSRGCNVAEKGRSESLRNTDPEYGTLVEYSLTTTLSIAINMIKLLKGLHEQGLIHRDIKPDNFLFGLDDKCNQLYLIDFGFSKKYMKSDGITHIDITTNKTLIGTPNFVSINMYEGIEPSRRDDLESVGYIMIYLLRGDGHDIWNNTYDIKSYKENIERNDRIPNVIKQYLSYCRNIGFEQTPDYEYLIGLLTNCNTTTK